MRPLSDADVLTAWEKARAGQTGISGSLFLLAAAYPEEPFRSILCLSVGQRDGLLLELRERLFGHQLTGLAKCDSCKEMIEVQLDVSALKIAREEEMMEPLSIVAEGYEIVFRLPNSLDLAAIAGAGSVLSGRSHLLERLILSAAFQGEPTPPETLPERIVDLVEARMSSAEPQADIQLNLICGACRAYGEVLFDIASFFWKEIDVLALRLLREVHLLAKAYSWSETEVLAMSSWRRRCYMEMLGV